MLNQLSNPHFINELLKGNDSLESRNFLEQNAVDLLLHDLPCLAIIYRPSALGQSSLMAVLNDIISVTGFPSIATAYLKLGTMNQQAGVVQIVGLCGFPIAGGGFLIQKPMSGSQYSLYSGALNLKNTGLYAFHDGPIHSSIDLALRDESSSEGGTEGGNGGGDTGGGPPKARPMLSKDHFSFWSFPQNLGSQGTKLFANLPSANFTTGRYSIPRELAFSAALVSKNIPGINPLKEGILK